MKGMWENGGKKWVAIERKKDLQKSTTAKRYLDKSA
jgi:hypothetical protein